MGKGKAHCVEHNGVFMSLRKYADIVGVPRGTIMRRWAKGDRGERLSRPSNQKFSALRAKRECKFPVGGAKSSIKTGSVTITASEAMTVFLRSPRLV